jgi:AraC-like DNA-binding protein/mannose-6-phosphate isomerase-like protein (cupin superfamily)
MSKTRQEAKFDPGPRSRAAVTTLACEYAAGRTIALHFHDRDQVVFAAAGVMTVRAGAGAWVVPTHRAVWIPARVPHTIAMSGRVAMRTLYLRARLAKRLPRSCCVLNVPPLLRELILHACARAELHVANPKQRHLVELILDQLEAIETIPLQLPSPSDPRAWRVAEALLADPSDARTLAEICKACGAGQRTVERKFQIETGMAFQRWRQQLRLMQGMRLMAGGASVTQAALDSGYSTPSAFIAMFRKNWGMTPSKCFAVRETSKA